MDCLSNQYFSQTWLKVPPPPPGLGFNDILFASDSDFCLSHVSKYDTAIIISGSCCFILLHTSVF